MSMNTLHLNGELDRLTIGCPHDGPTTPVILMVNGVRRGEIHDGDRITATLAR